MGMFYCHGCDQYHDSKDGEYNLAADGREYCDAYPEELQKAEMLRQFRLDVAEGLERRANGNPMIMELAANLRAGA